MTGKAGVAPCGHPGEHVIGNYVRCLRGCDSSLAKAKTEPAYEVYTCTRCYGLATRYLVKDGTRHYAWCKACKFSWWLD